MAEKNKWTDPELSVLVALGSIAVHADEALSLKGHIFDIDALRGCLNAPGVQEWIAEGVRLSMLPVKR